MYWLLKVDHLCEYFRDRELEKRLLKTSLDILNPENSYLLKIVSIQHSKTFKINFESKIEMHK